MKPWEVSYERNWISCILGLKVGGTVAKGGNSEWVNHSIDMNSSTFFLRDEPSEIVGYLFERFWGFGVEDVSILRR